MSNVEEGAAVKLCGRFFVIACVNRQLRVRQQRDHGYLHPGPICAELESKRVGDTISFDGTELVIEEVSREPV